MICIYLLCNYNCYKN